MSRSNASRLALCHMRRRWILLLILAYASANTSDLDVQAQVGLSRVKRAVITRDQKLLWPEKTVYYAFDTDHPGIHAGFKRIFKELETRSCLKFIKVDASSKNFHVKITQWYGDECHSDFGYYRWSKYYQGGNSQDLNIGNSCVEMSIMRHELLHVLGLDHEFQAPDRDDYVKINKSNVDDSHLDAFEKLSKDDVTRFGSEYDFASVMHYEFNGFAINDMLPSIVPKDSSKMKYIKPFKNTDFSFTDLYVLNKAYKCNTHCRGHCPVGKGYFDNSCKCIQPTDPIFATWPPVKHKRVPESIIDDVKSGKAKGKDVTKSFTEQGGVKVLEVVGRNAFLVVLTVKRLPTDIFMDDIYLDSDFEWVFKSGSLSVMDKHFRTWWIVYDPNFFDTVVDEVRDFQLFPNTDNIRLKQMSSIY